MRIVFYMTERAGQAIPWQPEPSEKIVQALEPFDNFVQLLIHELASSCSIADAFPFRFTFCHGCDYQVSSDYL